MVALSCAIFEKRTLRFSYFQKPGFSPRVYTVLQLWCAKKAIYIELWPLGTIKVEKYVKWAVKKLGSRNTNGCTLETYFATLIS